MEFTNIKSNQPFSPEDVQVFTRTLQRENSRYVQKYIFLFGVLGVIEFFILSNRDGKPLWSFENKIAAFQLFVIVFALSLARFMIKDYVVGLQAIKNDLEARRKTTFSFTAQKYYDPIYNNYLLFFPEREDRYIRISKEDFDQLTDGETLYMEISEVGKSIMLLRSETVVIKKAIEFTFR